jgi:hypothetical protein
MGAAGWHADTPTAQTLKNYFKNGEINRLLK